MGGVSTQASGLGRWHLAVSSSRSRAQRSRETRGESADQDPSDDQNTKAKADQDTAAADAERGDAASGADAHDRLRGQVRIAKANPKTASAREIERQRQRQRIQVLEQQLMDQQLLRLSKPPTSSTAWEDPEDAVSESCAPVLHVQIQSISGGDSVVIACPDGATVLDLKRAIAIRLSVSVEQQILIARRHLDGQNQRLRDDMRLDEQLERVAGQVPATHRRAKVLLLVSQQIHVAWPAHLQQTSTKA